MIMSDAPAIIVTLDVREDIREGREPFRKILDAAGRLRDGEQLRIIAPFEPRPLINLLATQGLTATITQREDAYEVTFSAQPNTEPL